ncbi:hypothetical protein [Aliirhizobium smilacinae]|uniref:Uncharacterized protein n=1 Tax=Aliirhizobium smilacinae TaxID=1395944 RepID=A0A5C4XSX7_9HYPH|nr:hypothetical protein [Rhizobium smilacinae]TNM66472.1 hypothetical protein FHP24_09820 [Rhizobium smilacinae]
MICDIPGVDEIIKAAEWLAEQKEPPALVAPALKQQFGLNPSEAGQAALIARGIRTARKGASR